MADSSATSAEPSASAPFATAASPFATAATPSAALAKPAAAVALASAATAEPSATTAEPSATTSPSKVVRMTKWLWVKVEMERQMQRLAAEHLAFWHFWFLFLPSATLTMVSGALAFLSTSDLIEPSNRVLLVTVVGLLALVATFLQTLSDRLKFGSRADMHRSAVLDLGAIIDSLDFMKIDQIGISKEGLDQATNNVAEYRKMFSQVRTGCKSAIPLRVVQSFNTIGTRIPMKLPSSKDMNLEGQIGYPEIHQTVWNEIYCDIASYWLFPLAFPDPDRTMKAVLKRVHDDFAKDVSPQAEPKDHKARSKFATWSKSVNIGQLLLMREKLPLSTSGISERTSGSLPPLQVPLLPADLHT